ncbi:MAG: type II CAAX endopeptidase family protein [Erysipelotrichaceae bacterium]|nr:type II CAAX endopeptidase family protein [Erysipelotrichaceae bacterium]
MKSVNVKLSSRIAILLNYFLGVIFIYPAILELIIRGIKANESLSILLKIIYTLVITVVFIFIMRKALVDDFKNIKGNYKAVIIQTLKYLGLMLVANLIIGNLLNLIGSSSENEAALKEVMNLSLPLLFVNAVIFAPIVEEAVFRLAIFRPLREKNRIVAYVVSSVLFGLLHVIGSANLINYLQIILYASMGYFLAKNYEKNNSLIASISLHFLNNLLAFTLSMFLK